MGEKVNDWKEFFRELGIPVQVCDPPNLIPYEDKDMGVKPFPKSNNSFVIVPVRYNFYKKD